MTDLTSRSPARVGVALATLAASFRLPAAAARATRTAPESRAMPHCTQDEINNGAVKRDVQILDRGFQVTHSVRKRVARGTEFSRTVTLGSTNQVTASISGTTTIEADAGAFFAKASAEASVTTLAGNKQKTTTESLEERFTIPATNRDRLFVFYDGLATYRFQAHKRVCAAAASRTTSASCPAGTRPPRTATCCARTRGTARVRRSTRSP